MFNIFLRSIRVIWDYQCLYGLLRLFSVFKTNYFWWSIGTFSIWIVRHLCVQNTVSIALIIFKGLGLFSV